MSSTRNPAVSNRALSRTGVTLGRPRDSTRDAVIYAATTELLIEQGYDRLSIEAVATRARVSKATIYRRHRDKAALVVAALEQRAAAQPPRTEGLPLRQAVLQTLQWLAEQVQRQESGLLGAAVTGLRAEPALVAAMHRILKRDQEAMLEGTLGAARRRAEPLNPGADQLFLEVAPAVVVHRVVFTGQACDGPFLEHLVDEVLLPLLCPSSTPPP